VAEEYAFQQNRDKCSSRQFNHLDFIAQFTTDIRHISGQDNVVADALSRIESVTAPPSYETLAASQGADDELRALLGSTTALRLEKLPNPRHHGLHILRHVRWKSTTFCTSSPTAPGFQIRPCSIASRHQNNSNTGVATFRLDRRSKGLPYLGTRLPVLPAL
jgi:hypothetical protein